MSMLGVIVRARPTGVVALGERLRRLPGVNVAHDPGDGRLILVVEDAPGQPAASRLAEIASWSAVVNVSLVYEYSGADLDGPPAVMTDYTAWRGSTWATPAVGSA